MNGIIEEAAENISTATEQEHNFATIAAIYADGVTLIFDGEDEATEKHYKCNSFAVFAVGQRVKIIKDSGTYVVEYPVGNPRTSFTVDNAARLNNKLEAQLSVQNAAQLNGKTESSLSVSQAERSVRLINAYSSNAAYDIQFYLNGNTLQVRIGTGTWRTISLA